MTNDEEILTMNTSAENAVIFLVVISIIITGVYILYKMKDEIEEKFSSYIKKDIYKPDIDIRYINLDRRKDRDEKIIIELNKSDIIKPLYKRVNAVDGKKVNLEQFSRFNSSYESLNKKRGWIGCAESHKQLWRDCIKGNKNMLIFEDDAILKDEYDENIEQSLKNLPNDFDIIYYNTVDYAIHEPYNKLYNKLTNKNFLLTNYLVSPSGADKLLKYTEPYNPKKQIDSYIVEMTRENILNAYLFKLPTTYTIQDFNESDVQEKKNVKREHNIHANII